MPHFDRFDICEAYYVLEIEWNNGGWLPERPSNRRRREATQVQLNRMKFKSPSVWSYDQLSDNGQEIYLLLCERYGLDARQGEELSDHPCPGCGKNMQRANGVDGWVCSDDTCDANADLGRQSP